MRLSANPLKNVDGLNAFVVGESWVVRSNEGSGETVSLYFQIVDLDREGIRYIPGASATMQVTFPALDDEAVIIKDAAFPFVDDRSIMRIDMASNELPSSGAVKFALTEGGNTKIFTVYGMMQIEKADAGSCC